MNTQKILGAATVALGLLSLSAVPASAIPFSSGSFALGAFTSTTTAVNTTTLFTLSSAINGGSAVGDFAAVVLPSPISSPAALDFGAGPPPVGFDFTNSLGTFTATSAVLTASAGGNNAFAKWNVVGSFTVGAAFSNPGDVLTANETWSLTQTGGAGDSISLSGTFHSPAVPVNVPEPASLALLGAGLVAAGVVRRRKAKAQA